MIRALGLMSGTSMDGVDAAVLETDGVDAIRFGPSQVVRYPDAVRETLLAARGWVPAPEAGRLVEAWHGPARLGPFGALDLIGFHGQTLAHDPARGRSRQLGRGDLLARAWGVPVAWDMRAHDLRMGGQGAPLAPFFQFHALRAQGVRGKVAVLNLGGVGNVTWADLDAVRAEAPGALLAFDTGPGNALMDDLMRAQTGASCDAEGARAAQGQVDLQWLARMMAHRFFQSPPPKSLDRDAWEMPCGGALEDRLASLAAFTIASVAAARRWFPAPALRWLVTGGGRHNRHVMAGLAVQLEAPVAPIEAVGLDGDLLEAQAFAWLAVRVLRGLPLSAPGTTGVARPVSGGRLSRP